jgi:23S rRNA pseudouridine1911/1915/1917 synthase
MSMRVIYEDNHLLAVAKPAGLPTMGAAEGIDTLLDVAKAYIREKHDKPGNVYLGVVSRLDAPVTGLLLMARTSKAASRLNSAFRERQVEKRYLACVEGEAHPCEEPIVHYLRKDERHRKVHVTHEGAEGAQRAELSYHVLLSGPDRSILEVAPVTGRKHQIRVQLAKLGLPIWGDRKYGGKVLYKPGIGLHSWRLTIEHPVRRIPLWLEAPPASGWGGLKPPALAHAIKQAARPDEPA